MTYATILMSTKVKNMTGCDSKIIPAAISKVIAA